MDRVQLLALMAAIIDAGDDAATSIRDDVANARNAQSCVTRAAALLAAAEHHAEKDLLTTAGAR